MRFGIVGPFGAARARRAAAGMAAAVLLAVAMTAFEPAQAAPYVGARAAAGMLPNSRLLTLNGWGHTSLGRSACIGRYITGYLVNLTLPPAGTVCQSNRPPFGGPAAVESSRAAAAFAELLPAPLVRALPSW